MITHFPPRILTKAPGVSLPNILSRMPHGTTTTTTAAAAATTATTLPV